MGSSRVQPARCPASTSIRRSNPVPTCWRTSAGTCTQQDSRCVPNEEFTRRFNAYVEENIDPITLQPQVEIDSELFFSNITPAFRRDLNRFQPFGPGNPAPVFVTRGVVSHGETKLVGADCEHLRMDLMQRQKPNTTIQTIAFQQPTHYEWIRAGHPIDVCYQIVENHYRGSVSVQLRIKDIKPLRGKQ